VALVAPNGRDYSVIIETAGAKTTQQLRFALAGKLSHRPLHGWRTDAVQQFERVADLKVSKFGEFAFDAAPASVYSLTTTTGQRKGNAVPPALAPFPAHYQEDFSDYSAGSTPRYFCDFAGVFEVARRHDGLGNALCQILEHKGIEWQPNAYPESFVGDPTLKDYTVGVDALLEGAGFVSLFGRVALVHQNADPPGGYELKVANTGAWELLAGGTNLITGTVLFSARTWHRLELSFAGNHIAAAIDGRRVADLTDDTFAQGNAGLGCGWHRAQFTQFAITTTPSATGSAGPSTSRSKSTVIR
jgi:hypothetical protein